jgi:hypothetical protein
LCKDNTIYLIRETFLKFFNKWGNLLTEWAVLGSEWQSKTDKTTTITPQKKGKDA